MLSKNLITDGLLAKPRGAAPTPEPAGLKPAQATVAAVAPDRESATSPSGPMLGALPPPFVRIGQRKPDTNTEYMLHAFAEKAESLGLIDADLRARLTPVHLRRSEVEHVHAVYTTACERRAAVEGSAEEPERFVDQKIAAHLSELCDRMMFELHMPPVAVQGAILHALLDAENSHRAEEAEIEKRLARR